MVEIDLLKYPVLLKEKDGKRYVFDPLRKKYLVLTPEELVRQKFVTYLLEKKNYPRSLFKLESGLKYGEMAKRSDILVYDQKAKPYLLIECKSYKVKISNQVFDQVSMYNRSIKARFLGVTNGMEHFFYEMDYENHSFLMLSDVPDFKVN